MRRTTSLIAALLGMMLLAHAGPSAAAADGYLVTDADAFEMLDLTTLATTSVGVSSSGFSALSLAPNGKLYGVAGPMLYEFDKLTGASTPVAQLPGTVGTSIYEGLTFDARGRLFTSYADYSDPSSPTHQFIRINPSVGSFEPVGTPSSDLIDGLAGTCGGPVFALAADGRHLLSANMDTGEQTPIGLMGDGLAVEEYLTDIAYDHLTRRLYGTTNQMRLFVIDPATAELFPTSYAGAARWVAFTLDGMSECRYKRSLSIGYSKPKDAFAGILGSSAPHCYKNKRVVVYKERSGADLKIGSDVTDASGAYLVAAPFRKGTYYAKVTETAGNLGVCLARMSTRLTLG